jgi:hypothetical protein
MAITTEAGLIAARAAGAPQPYLKSSIASVVAGQKFSLYRAAGSWPAQPAIPAAAVVCNNATAGAIPLPFVVGGGNTVYVDAIAAQLAIANQMELVDRLIHSGGLSGIVVGVQAINTPALPARATDKKVRWYLEWYTDTGATASNATVAFTHTDATTNTAVIAVGGTVRAGRKIEIVSSAGKQIASIQQITSLSASTGTAGNFGVVAECHTPIKAGVLAANGNVEYESLIRKIGDGTECLSMNMNCSTTSTGIVEALLTFIQG